jgi:predicted nucleotidyltransferase
MEAILLKEGNQNALVVKAKNGTFLIDTTPHINEKLQEEGIEDINCLILTKQPEGIEHLLKWLSKKDISKLVSLMPIEVADSLRATHNLDLGYLDILYYQPEVSVNFGDIGVKVTPFEGGLRLWDIVYLNGSCEVKHEYLENAKIILANECKWFNEEDKRLGQELQAISKANPEQVVISGAEYPENAEQALNQYWQEIHGKKDTKLKVAFGNIRIKLKEHISQVLHSLTEGMIIANAQDIYEGHRKLIVDSRMYNNKIDKLLYLMDKDFCYGIMRLKRPDKVNLDEFKTLEDKHKITDEERQKWWPYKEILYSYNFELEDRFDCPKRIILKEEPKTPFVEKWEYAEQELIQGNIKYFDPESKSTAVLKDDWRIVNAWYSSKKGGLNVKYSLEDIINLAKMIYLELKKRGVEFHPESMKKYAKELYDKLIGNSLSSKDLSDPELLKEFEDKKVIKDFISVVGSYAEGKQSPHDIDILVRMSEPTEFLKRAVETRISKDLSFSENIHFIWGDPEGPHDTYIPLYDLKLERVKPLQIIKMTTESIELSQLSPFYPMKPAKRFYEVEEVVKFMFEKGDKYSIEKKFNGYRGVLIKRGNSVKIYSDQKKDISRHFNTIIDEAEELANGDIVLDAEIVYGDGGRSQIAKYVTGKSPLDDSKITLHVFDILYYKKDLSNEPWYERKAILHSLNFGKHIKEVNSIIVNNVSKAKKAINFCRNLQASEGAVIKKYNSKYKKNGESADWIKFRNMDSLIVKVLSVNKKEKGNSYTVGIKGFDKANSKYVKEGFLELGNTFVTDDVDAKEGDNIQINIEEVWKHSFKDNTIRFSIHKPEVLAKTDKPLSSWEKLDDLAVSKGEEVVENELESTPSATTAGTGGISETQGKKWKKEIIKGPKTLAEEDTEGGEVMVKNFPDRMQRNFKEVTGWKDFVIQWHLRGEESIHTDLRMDTGL